MTMKATIGRTVILHGIFSNGSAEHPAIINRAWSDRDTAEGPVCINVTVFPDCGEPQCKTSVYLFETKELAHAHHFENPHAPVCYWPPRV
jgi:hypothetical protein